MALMALVLTFSQKGLEAKVDLQSKQAYLLDATTQTVLYEKNAHEPTPPSSMSKMMTVYALFKAIKNGEMTLDTIFTVSEQAWRRKGSSMFLNIGERVTVSDLIKGAIVQSGNDACITLAEGYMGTEDSFSQHLNQLAQDMGLKATHFTNATGWPDAGHVSTMADLVIIAQKTIEDFPTYYTQYYGIKEFTHNGIRQMNRNPLLYVDMGSDGLKTGHTDVGGYGLVASAVEGNRRLILAINGAKTSKQRALDAEALMRYGFKAFISPRILGKDQELDRADIWLGKDKVMPLTVEKDFFLTFPRHQLKDLKVDLVYKTPLQAPMEKGTQVGIARVTAPDGRVYEVPLVTARKAEKMGFVGRLWSQINYLLSGHN